MNVEIYKVKPKLTSNILAQVQEATVIDMLYAMDNGKVFGYINPIGNGLRVFLIQTENGDYRKVTNYPWKSLQSNPTTLVAHFLHKGVRKDVQKPFSTEAAKIKFFDLFTNLKKIALLTHIYV